MPTKLGRPGNFCLIKCPPKCTAEQLCAIYLEGYNISTKIGSGRDRGGLPDFLKNRDWGGLPDFQNFRGNSRKVEANLNSPRLLAKSRGESG